MFDSLVHADWSANDRKKWMASAERFSRGWHVNAPRLVPPRPEFLEQYLLCGRRVLAGFDFPIGVPAGFGSRTGFGSFLGALAAFGKGEWADFFKIADIPEEISLKRPFYPRGAKGGHRQAHLLKALGVKSMDDLRRECDLGTEHRPAACSIFWTLGGNQVGRAAIDGWQSVVLPSLDRGARVWPFNGRLHELQREPGCVLCETYPREAYGHVDVRFERRESKRVQEHRRNA